MHRKERPPFLEWEQWIKIIGTRATKISQNRRRSFSSKIKGIQIYKMRNSRNYSNLLRLIVLVTLTVTTSHANGNVYWDILSPRCFSGSPKKGSYSYTQEYSWSKKLFDCYLSQTDSCWVDQINRIGSASFWRIISPLIWPSISRFESCSDCPVRPNPVERQIETRFRVIDFIVLRSAAGPLSRGRHLKKPTFGLTWCCLLTNLSSFNECPGVVASHF